MKNILVFKKIQFYKLFILLLAFTFFFSCEKKIQKKEVVPSITKPILIIEPKGKAIAINSLSLNYFNSKTLKDFYKSTKYKTAWQSKKNRKIILQQLENSAAEGLNPNNYNIDKLKKYDAEFSALDDQEIANYDILLTYSLQKYIRHLTNGSVNPRKLYVDFDLHDNKIDINQTISNLIESDSLEQKIERLKPNHVVYKNLKKALQIIDKLPNDAFTKLEIKDEISPKDTNPLLIDIKKRLIYWKDLKLKGGLTPVYDLKTTEAIKKFQIRHGLTADGVIGNETIYALNFSKKERREQIIANLERWKWFPKDLGTEYIIVNIPDYKLTVVNNKHTVRVHRIIVGKPERKTPVLSSKLSHVVFNPTWTVPPTILKEDVIPSVSKNRDYLTQKNITVYDTNGIVVDTSSWKLANASTYNYVQSPGTFNSLGMVKLIFPNRFSVYLHDTNHRSYFDKNRRSLSSGCVRVQNPLELTAYLLNDTINWNLNKITKTLQRKSTKQVKIKKNVMIHLLYWTAWSENNRLMFREDIYALDTDLYSKIIKKKN